MRVVCRLLLAAGSMVAAIHGTAGAAASGCPQQELEAHVRQQFAIYGPQSRRHEYFGFVYLHDGVIGSAVTRSRACSDDGRCLVDSSNALRAVHPLAEVLGEWHTHPHEGSSRLSMYDVRGAYSNRHIGCYSAFYSTPSGEIYTWNVTRMSVPVAMASRRKIGRYRGAAEGLPALASAAVQHGH